MRRGDEPRELPVDFDSMVRNLNYEKTTNDTDGNAWDCVLDHYLRDSSIQYLSREKIYGMGDKRFAG